MDLKKKQINLNEVSISYFDNEVKSEILFFLIHGWMGSKNQFIPLIKHLTDYHCIAIDLRGHGESTSPDSEYNLDEFVADCHGLLEDYSKGVKEIVVIAHSMGGLIALKLASKLQLSNLVLLNSTIFYRRSNTFTNIVSAVLPHVIRKTLIRAFLPLAFGKQFRSEEVKYQVSLIVKTPKFVAVRSFNNAIKNSDVRELAGTYQGRVLLISGDADPILPHFHSKYINKTISNSTLYKLKNSGHFSLIEQPKLVSRMILSFFKTELPSRRT